MQAAISTNKLTKYYGKTRGIEDLDLEIRRGEVFGYLGPNGAGKSTTIRLLLDLIRATTGTAEVLGMDSRRDALSIRQRTGYLPGELSLYENLTGREFLEYLGRLRGLEGFGEADVVAERLGLDLGRPIGTLSKGNKQKVGLTQAFMHSPEVLILDEPTSGLDPLVQREFHQLVAETATRGATVLLSSHVLSEVEQITHRVGIIRSGRLVVVDDIEHLKQRAVSRIDFRFARDDVPPDAFQHLSGVREVDKHGRLLSVAVEGSVDELTKTAARYEVLAIKTHEPDLEEVFLAYYKDDADAP
ncbi:MAG: beta-exotoxin transport system ATP-binding protein [Actinomycetota bacterium]|jgi:ABC-2 type transport system ATP-binding protein|nr:beta-exotoxin transport system ATP-binding protein [Actinomycetota bacterium]